LTVASPRGSRSRDDPTLLGRLAQDGHRGLLGVHRLDRETSGVVLFARDAAARDLLMAVFKARQVEKTYRAIVQGAPRPSEGVLVFPIKDLGASAIIAPDGQPAETRYRVVSRIGPASLVEIDLLTGRHNQVRLHFAHIGHPLVGERKYARGKDALVRHKRAALHAFRLRLTLPWSDRAVSIEAPWPLDLANLEERLRAHAE
jgi:RluA family pseudouridine synthase